MEEDMDSKVYLSLCPICIETFRIPRSTPNCKHSFCEECLFTYVSTLKDRGELGTSFPCPVCRQDVTAPKDGEVSLSWIQTFPVNEQLAKVISEMQASKEAGKGASAIQEKIDGCDQAKILLCDPCTSDGDNNRAVKFCIECQENLCKVCVEVHRKYKLFKGHTLMEDNIQERMSDIGDIAVDFKCKKHGDRDVEIYCNEHDIYCCFRCLKDVHMECKGIQDIAEMGQRSDKIMERVKQKYELLEIHLDKVSAGHEESLRKLSNRMDNIQTIFDQKRENILRSLDDLQKELNLKKKQILMSSEKTCDETSTQTKDLKLRLRQNINKIDTMYRYSLPVHKAVMQKDMVEEYIRLEKDMGTGRLDVEELDVKWPALDKFDGIYGTIVACKEDKLVVEKGPGTVARCEDILNQMKDKRFERTEDHTVRLVSGCSPTYTGVTMAGNQQLVLCDNCSNCSCGYVCLYDIKSKSLSKLKMNKPFGVNVLKSKSSHIAVSVPNDKQIHVVSTENNTLTTVKTFQTDKKPYSLICLDNGQLGVTWDNPPSFDIVDVSRNEMKTVKSYTQDSTGRKFKSFEYVAVDELRSHIIQTCIEDHAVYCFDYSGNPVFEYRDVDLKGPRGVDTDRDGNIYICSGRTRSFRSLHVLTPSGRKIQVIKEGVPAYPRAICFDGTGENFWVTAVMHSEFKEKVFLFKSQ